MKLKICLGSSCFARGNGKVLPYLDRKMKDGNPELELAVCLCQNKCSDGPNISIDDQDYGEMSLEKIKAILGDADAGEGGR